MGLTISASYQPPETVVVIKDVSAPALPSTLLFPAFVGTGSRTVVKTSQFYNGYPFGCATEQDVQILSPSTADIIDIVDAFGNPTNTIIDSNGKSYTRGPAADWDFSNNAQLTHKNCLVWHRGGPQGALAGSPVPTYWFYYRVEKQISDYSPINGSVSSLQESVAQFGPAAIPTTIVSGTDSGAGTTTTIVDATNIVSRTAVVPGMYVIVNGETRAILDVNATSNTITIASTALGAIYGPFPATCASQAYTVTDIPYSAISLAAAIAFENNVSMVMGSQVMQATNVSEPTYGILGAINALQGQNAYAIVPVGLTDSTTRGYIANFVASQSNPLTKKECIGLLSGPTTLYTGAGTPTYINNVISILTGLNSNRLSYVIPTIGMRTVSQPYIGKSVLSTFDGSFLAAAVAGLICSDVANYNEGEPITLKMINGFDGGISYATTLGDLLATEKNQIAAYGAFILEQRGTSIVIRHALTTSQKGTPVSQELKVTIIADVLAKQLRSILDSTVIGTRDLGPTTDSNIRAIVTSVLNSKVQNDVISGFKNLSVQTDPNEPRQKDVSFQVKPAFDIDWILIVMGVGPTL